MMTTSRKFACLMAITVWSNAAIPAKSHPIVLGPAEVLELGGGAFSSSISSNGLELYYLDENVNTVVATRDSVTDDFGEPTFVSGDLHPELTRDGLSLFLNQDPGPYGAGDISFLSRSTLDESFEWRAREWLGGEVNTAEWERWPAVSSDGLELYFARSQTYSGPFWEIWVAGRASTSEPWGDAVRLPDAINVGGSGADSPDISADGLTLFFTSDRPGGFGADDIWASTRTTVADPWSDPINLGPLVNTDGVEWQPDISAEGTTLYFSQSFRSDFTDFQILHAPILLSSIPGDFDKDGALDVADIDELTRQSANGMNLSAYDLNGDAVVDASDVNVWAKDLFKSWIGDANLDKQFNSSDLVAVLASGTYEADVAAVWSTGDFEGDGRANSSDLVAALADGGYELGPRATIAAVPEPSAIGLLVVGALLFMRRR